MASSIEEALVLYLDTQLTSLLGAQRVFYADAPQNTQFPYVTLKVVSATNAARTLCLQEAGAHRVDFNVYSKDKFQCLSIGRKIIDLLRFYHGTMESITVDSIRPNGVVLVRETNIDDVYFGIVEAEVSYIEI
jgi:hypothetical protein